MAFKTTEQLTEIAEELCDKDHAAFVMIAYRHLCCGQIVHADGGCPATGRDVSMRNILAVAERFCETLQRAKENHVCGTPPKAVIGTMTVDTREAGKPVITSNDPKKAN